MLLPPKAQQEGKITGHWHNTNLRSQKISYVEMALHPLQIYNTKPLKFYFYTSSPIL
jgi:hypothetical protein